jgi:hypothetical protein
LPFELSLPEGPITLNRDCGLTQAPLGSALGYDVGVTAMANPGSGLYIEKVESAMETQWARFAGGNLTRNADTGGARDTGVLPAVDVHCVDSQLVAHLSPKHVLVGTSRDQEAYRCVCQPSPPHWPPYCRSQIVWFKQSSG